MVFIGLIVNKRVSIWLRVGGLGNTLFSLVRTTKEESGLEELDIDRSQNCPCNEPYRILLTPRLLPLWTVLLQLWSNPFDVGCKGNWQQVFGPQPFLLALLPSRRSPPPPLIDFFPLEDEGQDQRQRFSDVSVSTLVLVGFRLLCHE